MTDAPKPVLSVHSLFAERHQIEEARHAAERAAERRAAEELARQEQAFAERPLTEADIQAMLARIHAAFDQGEREVMLLAFPSTFCPDGGRRINHALEGWQDELPGYAGRLYAYWEEALRPGGFGFSARVITFPHGMPGDIGLFITWPEVEA